MPFYLVKNSLLLYDHKNFLSIYRLVLISSNKNTNYASAKANFFCTVFSQTVVNVLFGSQCELESVNEQCACK